MPPATSTQDNGAERETGEKVAKPAAGDLLILAAWRALFAAIDLPRVYGSESLDVTGFLGGGEVPEFPYSSAYYAGGGRLTPHGG